MCPAEDPVRPIVVPGSISNLGPGFDALSVAVNLYLRLDVLDIWPDAPGGLELIFPDGPPAGENRIETAFRRAEAAYGPAPGLRARVTSEIPVRAGLGSSAAAAVAGLLLHERFTAPRDRGDLLVMATGIEGHPDNAAAALHGGLTLSCQRDDGRVLASAWPVPADLRFVVATPAAELETRVARGLLPTQVPLPDAVFNLQRALLFVRALDTREYGWLREALRDRWHQPARAGFVPGLVEALQLRDPAVLGVCLSGAGPSVAALASADRAPAAAAALQQVYDRLPLPCTIRTLTTHPPSAPPSGLDA